MGSLNLNDVVLAQRHVWFCLPLLPMFVVFFISGLAETNRPPFDLPEGESELVGGFMTEYSSMTFALFFLGEYTNMILMSAMTAILFLGGWLAPFGIIPFTWIPGPIWLILKIVAILFCLHLGAWHVPTLSLRPVDAARLESVPAALPGLDGADRRLPGRDRPFTEPGLIGVHHGCSRPYGALLSAYRNPRRAWR